MIDSSDRLALLDELADDFVTRYRRGERPSLELYLENHPELEPEIRELFPALAQMEQADDDLFQNLDGKPFTSALPDELGDYRILREIGRGGMGVVYEAEQQSLGRRVALKLLPLVGKKDIHRQLRFQREARAAARLHHTNIVPVFEVGQDKNVCYYAMQFIQGQSLSEVIEEIKRVYIQAPTRLEPMQTTVSLKANVNEVANSLWTGRFEVEGLISDSPSSPAYTSMPNLPSSSSDDNVSDSSTGHSTQLLQFNTHFREYSKRVAEIGRQVAGALAYAHARGIIHRDIKPSNLLLDTSGVVWITDFGLAKTQEDGLTHTGDLIGTFRYMAPERFRGGGDLRADIYALGLSLYELLVFKPGFPGNDRLKLIDDIQKKEPIRLRAENPRIPRDLETIVLKAIEKDPNRRYGNADELAQDLNRFLIDEPVLARRINITEKVWRWCRRNRAIATLAAAVLLLITSLAVISTIGAFHLNQALQDSKEGLQRVKVANIESNLKLWDSLLSQAKASRMSRRVGQRFDSLEAVKRAMSMQLPAGRATSDLRDETIAALCLPDFRLTQEMVLSPKNSVTDSFDGRLELHAKVQPDGSIRIIRLSDGNELFRLRDPKYLHAQAHGVSLSSNGEYVSAWYYSEEPEVNKWQNTWDISSVTPKLLFQINQSSWCEFSSDGQRQVVLLSSGDIESYDLARGKRIHHLKQATRPNRVSDVGFTLHPFEAKVALTESGRIKILDLETGQSKHIFQFEGRDSIFQLRWHPKGQLLAAAKGVHIHLLDTTTGKEVRRFSGHQSAGITMSFHPRGDTLISSDWAKSLRWWNCNSGQLMMSMRGYWIGSGFSTEGHQFAGVIGGKSGIWEVALPQEYRTIEHQSLTKGILYYDPQVSRDGRLLMIGHSLGFTVWDFESSEQLASIPSGQISSLGIDAESGGLLVGSSGSLFLWPIENKERGKIQLGPPKFIRVFQKDLLFDQDKSGQMLAQGDYQGASIWKKETPDKVLVIRPHWDVRNVSLSPNGQWLATGSHNGQGVKIWDTITGHLIRTLQEDSTNCLVRFSPDGKWLATTGGEGRFLWSTETWEELPNSRMGLGLPAFANDGKMMAVELTPGVIGLVEIETNRVLACLEDPNLDEATWMRFSPDDSKLVAVNVPGSSSIHIWDLKAIRAELSNLKLDWNGASSSSPSSPKEPFELVVDQGKLGDQIRASEFISNANQSTQVGKFADARDSLINAIRLDPSNSLAYNNLAWLLVAGPKELRDTKRALSLARQAVGINTQNATYLNTLGVALYRHGDFREAIVMLEKSLRETTPHFKVYDLFFLAMCHHRLGDEAKAREFNLQANKWFEANRYQLGKMPIIELSEFQAEAKQVLAEPLGTPSGEP
jgi:serine/threonine protein kinase/WD40 repeat protein